MNIKYLIEEDFVNYKMPSMFIGMPKCDFKCERDCGIKCCQNSALAKAPEISIPAFKIIDKYLDNKISEAVVFGGLEPFDSWEELIEFISLFRYKSSDPVVIYTGYKEEEIEDKIKILSEYENIYVKFGRFVPNQKSHFDEVLEVELASPNQYAKKVSR